TCDYHNTPYCIAKALQNARNGLFAEGFAFAGANAYLVKNITTVKELIRELVQEYQDYYNKVKNNGQLELAPTRD
ncbi:MAG: hypothetical protein U1B83_06050, partial [Candidatus Cloacimonadaceae bacterium]|nr:hypothetical protein [Candidatus Cloacimonadaceae bacterium]